MKKIDRQLVLKDGLDMSDDLSGKFLKGCLPGWAGNNEVKVYALRIPLPAALKNHNPKGKVILLSCMRRPVLTILHCSPASP